MSPPPTPGSAALRADMVAKLKRAASLPRMKDGRRPPMPMHAEGVSEGERVTPHSNDPDVERRRAAHALGHEPDTETEGESGTVSEPTPGVGMSIGYGRTDSMRTVRPSDPPSGGLQRSATTSGNIESNTMAVSSIPFASGSEEPDDWAEEERDTAATARPTALVIPEQTVPVISPAPPPRKRTRSRSRSRSLERKRIAQQLKHQAEEDAQMSSSTDEQIPPIPLPGPDAIGPYSPLGYMTPTSATPHAHSRAQSPAQFEGFAAAAAARNAARTPPPFALLQQQLQARSRSPTPNLLGSPMFQMPISPTSPVIPASGLPTLDHIRDRLGDRLGANLFRSNSAAARILQQGGTGDEHQVPLPPSRTQTPASMSRNGTPGPGLGRSNTTGNAMGLGMSPTTPGGGDRTAVRQAMLKKIGNRVDKDRTGDGDQTSGAEDTVVMHGRGGTPFGRPITPGMAVTPGRAHTPVRSPTPGRGGAQTPGGDDGTLSSAPGTPTPGKRRRSHGRRKSKSSGVGTVVDDRDDAQPAPSKPEIGLTYSPQPQSTQTHMSPPPNEDDDDDDDQDITSPKGLERQRSVKLERDKALQKLAGGTSSRLTLRPPLVEEDDEDGPSATSSLPGVLTPVPASTPQPRIPHASDISVQSGMSIPVFIPEQGSVSPYKMDSFPVPIGTQYHRDAMGIRGSPARVVEDIEDHEGEQVVYPEDPTAKARRTFNESLERNGGSKLGMLVPTYSMIKLIVC